MKRLYAAEISYLLLCGIAATAWVVPALFAVVGIFTLGLAWLVPTFWIYNSAFVPGYLAALWLQRVGAFWVISIPLVIALAMGPTFIAEQEINQVKSDLYRGDFRDEMPTASQHIAFQVEPLGSYTKFPEPLSLAPCDILCQRLLLNRAFKSVTIETEDKNAARPLSIEYRLEPRNACPRVFAKTRQAIPDLLRANIEGRCLIATIDKPMLNGLVVHEERPVSLGSYRSSFWSIRKLERFSVAHRKNGIDVLIARRTYLEIDRVAYPTMLLTYGGIFTTVSEWRYASIADSTRINSVIDFLEHDLKLDLSVRPTGSSLGSRGYGGIRLTAMGGTHVSLTSADVRKLLAAPPDSPLNDELQGLINKWASQFSIGKEWEAVPTADVELAVSLIDDPRMTTLDGVVFLLQGKPDLLANNLDRIFRRITSPTSMLKGETFGRLSRLWATSVAKPLTDTQSAQIARVLEKGIDRHNDHLLILLANQGVSGRDLILRQLRDRKSYSNAAALVAACVAGPELYALLADAVQTNLDPDYGNSRLLALKAILINEGPQRATTATMDLPDSALKQLERVLTSFTQGGKSGCHR